MKYTQENRRIAISTALGDDVVLLRGFSGEEGISRFFRFHLDLLSDNDSMSFDQLVGTNVTLRIKLADGSNRYWNGYLNSVCQGGRDALLTSYEAEMVPWLWFLTQTSDCRIFQNKKTPDIIQQVFSDRGFRDFALRLQGGFAEREYCVQYRETDFNFLSRLMEEEGIYYFFEHENGKHTLVLANSPDGHKPCPNQNTVRYELSAGGWQEDDVISEWRLGQSLVSGSYAVQDYNFETPNTDIQSSIAGRNPHELFEYPGGYLHKADGEQLARIRLEEKEAGRMLARGVSDCRAFASGCRFDLLDHYRPDQNQAYVLTGIQHKASQGGDFRSGASPADGELSYRNEFECIPFSVPFRPQRRTPRPVIHGAQTAVVVGPGGEEIWTDKYGRVKVQFYWDRHGQKDDKSSCWIRVSQAWAGKNWGAISIPRIGQEVVVNFLEGDPDRPLITGRVYNADQVVPYDLPGEQTKSTLKTLSSKGGGGFNELRFEDKKGNEQIFLHAERNLDVRVKQDRFQTILGESHLQVGKDCLEDVSGDLHLHVKGDQNEKVDGTVSLQAGQDLQTKVGMNHGMEAGMGIHLKAGMNFVLESGTTLTLKVGGNFINLNPGGVFISGTMVMINSGGAAGSGAGCSPQPPKTPTEADKAQPGQIATPKPSPPPKPGKFSPAAIVMKQAAKCGAPFCEH